MLKIKKSSYILKVLCISLCISLGGVMSASATELQTNKIDKKVTNQNELVKIAQQYNIPATSNGQKLKEIVIHTNSTSNNLVNNMAMASSTSGDLGYRLPWGTGFYRGTNWSSTLVGGITPITTAYGTAGTTISINRTSTVTFKLSSTFTLTNGTLSAQLGVDVSKGVSISQIGSHVVSNQPGIIGTLKAFPMYTIHYYDVYFYPIIGFSSKVGSGSAWEPSGVAFAYYEG